MRALVLGAGGQLGSDLARLLPEAVGLTHREQSITDRRGLEAALALHRPEVVFNCAAYNAVDRAEAEREQAFEVNSKGASNAAAACRLTGARLVHFSTNYVFDGSLDRPYVESDQTAPLGVYAKSKLDGERRVMDELPRALVIRTAALYGDLSPGGRGGSFPERVIEQARLGERLRVVADQQVNPTYTLDLARAALELAAGGTSGVVHLVAAECCAWDDFARATLAASGLLAQVESVASDAFADAAPRPRNGCLGSERVGALRPWREALSEWAVRRTSSRAATDP